ncbi:F-box-like domain protein [Metarhizium robertsii]|uniref:F-box domain-containing protein n=2 Tax=Metarhizium robertsii TaxID=568076 RepID=E9EQ11_METRA|nr:F-box domain-containing protein [Metarhizium robertsii ARSEF 23]EFZ02317.2 F-box domain-containing protein [Metarhizium robertsii ARSEF 23]EXV05500.1 F-box-like domain protein [Metarhizium robertsii]
MHPLNPAVDDGQLIHDMRFNLASLPHSPASLLPEGVWLEDVPGTPLCASSDEVASHSTLDATGAQPHRPPYVDSCSRPEAETDNGCVVCPVDRTNETDDHVDNEDQTDGCHRNTPDRSSMVTTLLRSSAPLERLPNEVLLHILGFLDVSDLLATSRTSHLLRSLSLTPILHHYRLRRTRQVLPPLLSSPTRPTVAELISRSIFLTHTSVVSRRLAWSLVSIRLSRRLAARPSAEALVQRCVLPKECVPGMSSVLIAPALVAKRKAVEKEKVKDELRRWIAAKWKGEVREREEELRRWHESRGVGRVWKLTKFWERVSRGDHRPLC